jgi:hypothetical protein
LNLKFFPLEIPVGVVGYESAASNHLVVMSVTIVGR